MVLGVFGLQSEAVARGVAGIAASGARQEVSTDAGLGCFESERPCWALDSTSEPRGDWARAGLPAPIEACYWGFGLTGASPSRSLRQAASLGFSHCAAFRSLWRQARIWPLTAGMSAWYDRRHNQMERYTDNILAMIDLRDILINTQPDASMRVWEMCCIAPIAGVSPG